MRLLTSHFVAEDSVNHRLKITVLDEPGAGGANHRYEISGFDTVTNPAKSTLPQNALQIPAVSGPQATWAGTTILFQNGAIREVGVNGLTIEALLAIEIDRLRSFQAGPYADPHNQTALEHLEMALDALHARTRERIDQGIEGTMAVSGKSTSPISGKNVSMVSETASRMPDNEPIPVSVPDETAAKPTIRQL